VVAVIQRSDRTKTRDEVKAKEVGVSIKVIESAKTPGSLDLLYQGGRLSRLSLHF